METILAAVDGLDGPTAVLFGRKGEGFDLYITNGAFPFAQLPNDPAIQTVTLPTSLHAQLINARSEVGHENVAGLFWTATDLERKLVEFQQYYTSIARMRAGRAPAGAEPGPDRRSGESPRL